MGADRKRTEVKTVGYRALAAFRSDCLLVFPRPKPQGKLFQQGTEEYRAEYLTEREFA